MCRTSGRGTQRHQQRLTNGERLRGFAASALRDTESSAPRCGASGSASLT